MKLLHLINQNLKTILALAVVVLLILIFYKPCNKPGEKIEQLKAELKQVEQEKKELSNQLIFILAKHRTDSAEAAGKEKLAFVEKQEADKKVSQQQKLIDQLVAVVRNTPTKIDTPNAVLVSADFKNACDSLPAEIDKLNTALAEKDTVINQWTDILAYEVQQRDSTIDALKYHISEQDGLFGRYKKVTEDVLKAARPRGRLLGGVGLIGNEINPLSGTKINLAYQSRGGKQYQVGGILMRGSVYYEATVLITLIK